MQSRSIVMAVVVLGLIVAGPALARDKHKVRRHCAPQRQEFSLYGLWFNPHPQPNGCAPPVYVGGEYIGQDPDPFIRSQLRRFPATGYAYDLVR
jgi:hypothetical protein